MKKLTGRGLLASGLAIGAARATDAASPRDANEEEVTSFALFLISLDCTTN